MTKDQRLCLNDLENIITKSLWNKVGNNKITEYMLFTKEWDNNVEATKAAVQYLVSKGIEFFVISFKRKESTTFLMSGEYVESYHAVVFKRDDMLMVLDPLYYHEYVELNMWFSTFCERLYGTATLSLSDIIIHNMNMENANLAKEVFSWVKEHCTESPNFFCTNDPNYRGVLLESDHITRNWDYMCVNMKCDCVKAYQTYYSIYSRYIRTLMYTLTIDTDCKSKLVAVREGVAKQLETEV